MENEGESQKILESKYDCLLFDLDDTLYPLSSGLSANITKNIQDYMIQNLGIERSKVPELCKMLYINYGTTMAGLRAIGCKFDYDDFHSYVHGRLPYNLLKPDHVLKNLLHSLPIRKVLFTNSDKNHASRVLSKLGLEDLFEQIICFETLNNTDKGCDTVVEGEMGVFDINEYTANPNSGLQLPKTPVICKPFEDSYEQTFKIAKINPKRTVFFDDSIRNLVTGKRLGLTTVWVGACNRTEGADYALESIHNMKEALPELWEATEKSEVVRYSGEVAIETPVRA